MSEPKRSPSPPPRYNHDDVDARVLDLIRRRPHGVSYRELGRMTGYGMYVLTHSVKRLRARGLVIPGVEGRSGFLVATRGG